MLLTVLGREVLKIFLKSLGDYRGCDVSSSRMLALSSSFLEAVSSACFLKNSATGCLLEAEDSCSYAVQLTFLVINFSVSNKTLFFFPLPSFVFILVCRSGSVNKSKSPSSL